MIDVYAKALVCAREYIVPIINEPLKKGTTMYKYYCITPHPTAPSTRSGNPSRFVHTKWSNCPVASTASPRCSIST